MREGRGEQPCGVAGRNSEETIEMLSASPGLNLVSDAAHDRQYTERD